MLDAKAKWELGHPSNLEAVEKLANELDIEPLIAKLLIVRGLHTKQAVQQFMEPDESTFHDPFLLTGMREAVQRIRSALQHKEKIRIYGDYDADGVSSTALLIRLFSQLSADFDYYIPHRANEGYGLNLSALDHAHKQGVTLIITVDTGISAVEPIKYAHELGMDVIVTDHHEPPAVLPAACAIVNPKQPGCTYPFRHLAGVGVALKLAHALLGTIPDELLQLAAIGTVADMMPLQEENRLIVRRGLDQMRQRALMGIKALAALASIELKDLTEQHIGYGLAPRINACGRIDNAKSAVELLTATNEQEAVHLAHRLDHLNKERQRIVEEITSEAMQMIAARLTEHDDAVLVLAKEDWHVGVIGIVASQVLEQYYRPTIILSIDPDTGQAKGSARSTSGFDMTRALSECSELLEHYGGHQAAAGMQLHKEKIDAFREKLNELARGWIKEEDLQPSIPVDLECAIEELSLPSIEQLEKLAPFGQGNPQPRFMINHLRIQDVKQIGKEGQHLKLIAYQATGNVQHTLDVIGFQHGHLKRWISPMAHIDLLGEVSINEWNGVRRPQLRIHDLRISERQVFDWRGGKGNDWLKQLHTEPMSDRITWQPAIMLSSAHQYAMLPDELLQTECSIWVMKSDQPPQPLNEMAKCIQFHEAKDVIFYTLPEQLDQLKCTLQHAEKVERIYAVFVHDNRLSSSLPPRATFKKVYGLLVKLKQWDQSDPRILQALMRRSGISSELLQFILSVFEDLSFIEKTGSGSTYRFISSPDKRELESSSRYLARQQKQQLEQQCIYSTMHELQHWILEQLPNGRTGQ